MLFKKHFKKDHVHMRLWMRLYGMACFYLLYRTAFVGEKIFLKREIHSKIESILKERVHFFLQNSEKMMKIG